jgi:hypothetical protein
MPLAVVLANDNKGISSGPLCDYRREMAEWTEIRVVYVGVICIYDMFSEKWFEMVFNR